LDTKEYKDALTKLHSITRGAIDRILAANRLDAICAPTNGPSWCTDLINGRSLPIWNGNDGTIGDHDGYGDLR